MSMTILELRDIIVEDGIFRDAKQIGEMLTRVASLVQACQEARNYDQIGEDFPHGSAKLLEDALKELEAHGDVEPYVFDPTKF